MFLSSLLVNTGDDPDHPRPGRLWLRNVYRVHQRLCMAFPSAGETNNEDSTNKHVKATRDPEAGFLFRIDPLIGGRAAIIVQSALMPEWKYAFRNAEYLLSAPVQCKPFDPVYEIGNKYRFRLLANPTKKIDTKTGPDGKRNNGKRVAVPASMFEEWIERKAAASGFVLQNGSLTAQPSYIYMQRERGKEGKNLRSVLFEGILEVSDSAEFQAAVISGIGSGKAFGFGLLSLARM